jgi:hypothetical protein
MNLLCVDVSEGLFGVCLRLFCPLSEFKKDIGKNIYGGD